MISRRDATVHAVEDETTTTIHYDIMLFMCPR